MRKAILDNGFVILKEDERISSPIACLYYVHEHGIGMDKKPYLQLSRRDTITIVNGVGYRFEATLTSIALK
jgi:hypothetical protein